MWKLISVFFTCLFFTFQSAEISQSRESQRDIHAFLVADSSTVVPEKILRIGLLLHMPTNWHTFWKNPGSVGMPISVDWNLPEGFRVSALRWPIPENIPLRDGVVYGYRGKILLIADVQPPPKLSVKEITIRGHATWLACADRCVPGSANLALTLPVSSYATPKNGSLFKQFEQLVPTKIVPFPMTLLKYSEGIEIHVQPGNAIKRLSFLPLTASRQSVGRITATFPSNDKKVWVIRVPIKGNLSGILITENANHTRKGYELTDTTSLGPAAPQRNTHTFPFPTLLQVMLYAFLGGLILNLMPCILPVITLKIFGFIQQAGTNPRKIFHYGLAFTAGVFSWFLLLAGLVLLLKDRGHNWTAFQFQNPAFNFVIIVMTFVLALNLFGVFEISIPSGPMTGILHLAEKNGLWGAFFQGAFTTLLATPCTTPFLGTAFGVAINQNNNMVTLMVFSAAAAGLALPYLILSVQTGWVRFIPRPGIWMEWVKQLMGFPLIATTIWLLGVLGNQIGVSAMVATLAFLLCVSLCCWLIGINTKADALHWKHSFLAHPCFSLLVCPIIIASATYYLAWPTMKPYIIGSQDSQYLKMPWISYSPSVLHKAQAVGRPVFVNFTADWCLFCKFNEKSALDRPAVVAAFQSKGILPLKADWTNQDPVITATLRSFGRAGVPFYILYPSERSDMPIVLPEFLTEASILNTLNRSLTGDKNTIPGCSGK